MERSSRGKGGKRRPGGGAGPPAGRRIPPPESTEQEARFLRQCKESGREVVIQLRSGEALRGVIADYDPDSIRLQPASGPSCFVRKPEIRYLHEAD